MDGYGLILSFDSEDPEFARGFEAGHLWGLLRARPDERIDDVLVHAVNVEMVFRMGEATGRRPRGEELEGQWMRVSFDPTATPLAE